MSSMLSAIAKNLMALIISTLLPRYSPPPLRVGQILERPVSLDKHTREFLTAPAPTGRPNLAPALVQHGLQPIMLKRQRPNPSSVVKNFRQGLSKAGLGFGPFWTKRIARAWSSRTMPQVCRWPSGILPVGASADASRACPEFGPGH